MLRNLLPHNDNFFDFFERHATFIVQGAQELLSFCHPNYDSEALFQKIKSIEQEGDLITHQCVEALHKTFITPFDRTDIHHLISKLDDVLDEIKGVARSILLYNLTSLTEEAGQLVQLVLEASQEVAFAIKELRKMKNTELLKQRLININILENEADTILTQALSRLFDEEKDAVIIIKWKDVYEHLESATDVCEDVANILEGIILENE